MMIEEGMSFADALKIAQDKGYAEKDPTAEVEGTMHAARFVFLLHLHSASTFIRHRLRLRVFQILPLKMFHTSIQQAVLSSF